MANEKETFKLDLDAKDFINQAREAQTALSEIGEVESLKSLLPMLQQGTLALGAVAAACYTVKSALDLTLEAEAIKRVNQQFETLAATAGIAGETLKEGLEKAAGGLLDTEDLLGAANKALVTMGESASKLPALLEVAKNSTMVFGGSLLQNFEALNQAISSGQTRALRSLGIIVDSQAAYRDYANSIGVTVASLSEQEKKTALLNAVLEKSATVFKNTKVNSDDATQSFQRLKVSLTEMKDTFVIAFDRTIGPSVRTALSSLSSWAKGAADVFAGHFGSIEDQTKYRIKNVTEELARAQAVLAANEKSRESGGFFASLLNPKDLDATRKNIAMLSAELENLKAQQEKAEAAKPQAVTEAAKPDSGALARRLEERSKFEASLQEMTLARIKSEEEVATTIEQVDMAAGEKIVALRELRDARLGQLNAQRALQEIATDEELELKKAQVVAQTDAEIIRSQQAVDDARIASLRRFAEYNKNTMAGFAASVKATSAQATADIGNFSKMGQQFTTAFSSNASRAFKALGDGSKSASEAMGSFLLGTVADMAEAYGNQLLLTGLWPPNPLALAAGGALVALSGLLRSKAGGTSAGLGAQAAVGATYGTQTVPTAGGEIAPVPAAPSLPAQAAQKSVAVNIMGHYFETAETRRVLTDLIRQESDATQFTIQQIGQGA